MEQKHGLRRIYRKSWPFDNLFGSSRFELTSSQRGIWNDFLDMAKISRVRPGLIAPAPERSYPHAWLAEFLNVTLEQLDDAINVLIQTERIKENHNGIEILNWSRYQSEYDRQKPYRQRKKGTQRFFQSTPEDVEMAAKLRKGEITHEQYEEYVASRTAEQEG